MREIRQLMLDDPAYQDMSAEDEAVLKEALVAVRNTKKLGARTTNKSAAMDFRAVLEEINDMVSIINSFLFLPDTALVDDRYQHFHLVRVPQSSCLLAAVTSKTRSSLTGSAPTTRLSLRWIHWTKACGT